MILKLFILLLLIQLSISSCGIITINYPNMNTDETTGEGSYPDAGINDTPPDTVSTSKEITPVLPEDNQKAASKYLDSLTSRDFEGVGMVIASTDNTLFTPENDGSATVTARLLRNRAVEEKYNTIIMSNLCASADVMLAESKEALNAGMYYADLLAIPARNLGVFKSQNLLYNLNSLPFTDYRSPYYNLDAMKQMSGGYSIYGAAGELTENISDMYIIFFNKTILDRHNIVNPYLSVENGEWTWDKMREMILTVNDNINSSGNLPLTGHASQTDTDTYIDIMFASTGQHYMETGVGKIPIVSYNTTSTTKLIETARNLLYNDGTYFTDNDENTAMTSFINGEVLFYIDRLSASSAFINMQESWGILPIPKLNLSQGNYYTFYDTTVPVMAALASGVGVDKTGLLLQAMNAASYKHINDIYCTQLSNNVLRDNGSINMLDYIRLYPRYDFAFMFGSEYAYLPDGTYMLLRRSVKRGTDLEPHYSDFSQLIYKQMSRAFEMPNY